jgi:GT2 family glycosyltransferase
MLHRMIEALSLGDELFWEPARVVPPGPWAGHVPFAFWLAKTTRPATLVELGTHSGNSYFAFCQAIAATGAPGRAFAVDTWRGDEHAGEYGEEVFADVSAFNDAHFKPFSTLLRTTFDDARPYFADGTVDLLHIDGMHSYEAVLHDFEAWRGALSDRGVVVFHDTNVRERGFGVWRLWAELSVRHPSFEFHHSHGLGVLGVGPEQPAPLRALFEASGDPEAAAVARRLFAARGEAFQHRVQALEAARIRERERTSAEEGRASEAAAAAALGHQREVLAALERVVAAKDQIVRMQDEDLRARDDALRARDETLRALDTAVRARDAEIRARDGALAAVTREAAAVAARSEEAARAAAATHAAAMARLEEAYTRSTSWRLTAPLRTAVRALRREAPSAPVVVPAPVPADALPPSPAEAGPQPSPPGEAPSSTPSAPDHRALLRSLLSTRFGAFLSGGGALRLPRAGRPPDVSILLVLHNQAELTFGCLESIAATVPGSGLEVEVLVLDNASTDRTGDLLDRVEGAACVVRSAWNRHFLHGVNELAGRAEGRHILLLNNDAQLLPGALRAAVDVLDDDPSVGAVGGRVILPDGTLQEAGSIVWNDGTCLGYGRGRDPDDPDFMFRRDVDYCSGAFLMTPRAVFDRLGRFDPRYAPAYYEETDYCLRLWQAGLRVVFEPAAAILHLEFGSSASSAEALALQRRNHSTFRARHAAWLHNQRPPSPENVLAASRRLRPETRRVLMIEDRVPKPELGAGYPRANRLLRELVAAGAEVTFFPTFRHREDWAEVRRVVGPTIRVMVRAGADDLRPFLEARGGEFDAVLVCRPHNMQSFLDAAGADRERVLAGAKLIYDAEAVFARRVIMEAGTEGRAVPDDEARGLIAREIALAYAADEVLSVSTAELQAFQQHGAKSVRLLGHALDEAPTEAPFAARDGFVFFGAVPDDNAPNADSLRWFAREVLPPLRERLGRADLRLRVAGLVHAESVRALDGDALDLVGQVPDLAPAMASARVMVVPTRFAAGIPHKAHQAAALGVPMVVTDLIREQLRWDAGQELMAASDPAGFAEACARVHEDAALWERIRYGALERVRAECSPERFRRTVREVLAAVPAAMPGPLAPARPGPAAPAPAEAEPGFVGRPEEEDASVAVPFGYPPAVLAEPPRIAAVCHMFHPEVAEEALAHLRNIPFPADVFVSTDTEEKRAALAAVFAPWEQGSVEVRVLPNRGRDIAPKLVGFRDAHDRYDRVLHLHSKRSKHADFLSPWRTYLYETLLGSPAVVRSVFEAFERLPRLGMVAPQHFEPVRRWLDWSGNFGAARALAARMGIDLRPDAALDFPSGSMFWARTAALRPLLDLRLSFDEFPEEAGQVDGTPAHAIERLYFHVCERAGHTWMKVADPALLFDTRAVVRIGSPDDLARFVVEHGAVLASGALAKRAEAPPMFVRTPPGLLRRTASASPSAREAGPEREREAA